MKADTRLFGSIDIDDDKIILLENGMIGLPEMRQFALIFDKEKKKEKQKQIMWLQSMDDPETAFPVMQPELVKPDYAPSVSEELLRPLGEMADEDVFVLVTVTAAPKKEDTSVNLKAPVIINTRNNKGMQVIVEDDYPIKFRICEALKEKAGE
ncbi:MAG: flagellar assembly protein FliW [Roseburia sp.]